MAAWPTHKTTCNAGGAAAPAAAPPRKDTLAPQRAGGLFPDIPNTTTEDDRLLLRLQRVVRASNAGPGDGPNVLFKQLLKPSKFIELMYQGMDASRRDSLLFPASLQEFIEAPRFAAGVKSLMPLVRARVDSIIDGVKGKARADGQMMDEATEASLRPAIEQEAFAREVFAYVSKLGRQVHAAAAQPTVATVAAPTAAPALWNQVPPECGRQLAHQHWCVLDGFLEHEWLPVLYDDLHRMHEDQLLKPEKTVNELVRDATTEGAKTDVPAVSWIEVDACQDYPAVQELLQRMYGIPYELNRATGWTLSAPLPSSTRVVRYPAGTQQAVRVDNAGGDQDSGLAVSCVFQVRSADLSGGGLSLSKGSASVSDPVASGTSSLLLYDSRTIPTAIAPISSGVLFTVGFYIHGLPW